jgi:hypothetical protein
MTGKAEDTDAVEDLATLRGFLNAWDPYGLVVQGLPEDEWDRERREIYRALTSGDTKSGEELADRIAAIFEKSLGSGFTPENCSEIAHTIWSWWHDKQGERGKGEQ